MMNHNTMVLYTVAAIVAAIIIMSFCLCRPFNICRPFSKHSVCDISDNNELPRTSDNNGLLRTRLGMSGGLINFSLQELNQATNNFGESNLIGSGRLGPVYKGLIGNTLMLAIKRLSSSLCPNFLSEVTYLSELRHCNVVNLLGYCLENGHHMIVYEYLVNFRALREAVDFKLERRISIALGVAKGLQHLHIFTPPLAHKGFKTDKVFLDIDLNAKVPDAGLSQLLARVDEDTDLEVAMVNQESFDESKDVYNFGMFLGELITGEEPTELGSITSNEELIDWICPRLQAHTFVDMRINGAYTVEGVAIIAKIMLQCLKFPPTSRPKMKEIVEELEKIYPKDSTNEQGPTEITPGK